MPFQKAAQRTALAPRRSGAVVSKSRFEALKERSAAAQARIRRAADEDGDALIGVGTGIALALYEKPGKDGVAKTLPTIMGLDPALVWGAAGYAFTRKSKNKNARMMRQGAIALCTIGASRSATRGTVKVSGDGSVGEVDDGEDSDL